MGSVGDGGISHRASHLKPILNSVKQYFIALQARLGNAMRYDKHLAVTVGGIVSTLDTHTNQIVLVFN